MLIACLVVSALAPEFNDSVSPASEDIDEYWPDASTNLIIVLIVIWTILVASIAIIIELTCAALHILITRYCNVSSYYIVLGSLVRATKGYHKHKNHVLCLHNMYMVIHSWSLVA